MPWSLQSRMGGALGCAEWSGRNPGLCRVDAGALDSAEWSGGSPRLCRVESGEPWPLQSRVGEVLYSAEWSGGALGSAEWNEVSLDSAEWGGGSPGAGN